MSDQKSNLSETALEVKRHLDLTYEELWAVRDELGATTVELANKLIAGTATEEERIDFEVILDEIRDSILQPDLDKRSVLIRKNFMNKLERVVETGEAPKS